MNPRAAQTLLFTGLMVSIALAPRYDAEAARPVTIQYERPLTKVLGL